MNGQIDIQQMLSMLSNLGIGGEQGGIGGLMQLMSFMKSNNSLKGRRKERRYRRESEGENNRKVIDVEVKEDDNKSMKSNSSRGIKIKKKKRIGKNHKIIKRSVKKRFDE